MIIDVLGINLKELNLFPKNIAEEIIQNLRIILTTIVGTVPLDRNFGISSTVIDQPLQRAVMRLTIEITEKISEYEPRVEIKEIEFVENTDYAIDGKLVPKVKVRILDEYL